MHNPYLKATLGQKAKQGGKGVNQLVHYNQTHDEKDKEKKKQMGEIFLINTTFTWHLQGRGTRKEGGRQVPLTPFN